MTKGTRVGPELLAQWARSASTVLSTRFVDKAFTVYELKKILVNEGYIILTDSITNQYVARRLSHIVKEMGIDSSYEEGRTKWYYYTKEDAIRAGATPVDCDEEELIGMRLGIFLYNYDEYDDALKFVSLSRQNIKQLAYPRKYYAEARLMSKWLGVPMRLVKAEEWETKEPWILRRKNK